MLLGDGEHTARAARRIEHSADSALLLQHGAVAIDQQPHHQADHLARREVLARVFVRLLVEAPDQIFEDGPHRVVVHVVGMQVGIAQLLDQREQQALLVEGVDGAAHLETVDHLAHVVGEAVDVGAQVLADVLRVIDQLREVELRDVVEGVARRAAKLPVHVLQALGFQVLVPLQHLFLGRREHAVQPPQHGEWKDDVRVLAAFEVVAQNLIRYGPDEVRDFLEVIHCLVNLSEYRVADVSVQRRHCS